jgi:hypothetical protein
VALSDHLGPHQDVNCSPLQTLQDAPRRLPVFNCIPVHAGDPRLGKPLPHSRLELLGPEAEIPQPIPVTLGTTLWRPPLEVAGVAAQAALARVKGEGDAAVRTARGGPALLAHEDRRKSSAVEKEQGLLPPCEARFQRGAQGRREQPLAPVHAPQIHDLRPGEGPRLDPLREPHQSVASGLGALVALQRRRGRSQDHGRRQELGPHDGHVPSVVARRFLLLVGGIVLLVRHDDAQAR